MIAETIFQMLNKKKLLYHINKYNFGLPNRAV